MRYKSPQKRTSIQHEVYRLNFFFQTITSFNTATRPLVQKEQKKKKNYGLFMEL